MYDGEVSLSSSLHVSPSKHFTRMETAYVNMLLFHVNEYDE
jgi:hypothetical protein